MKHPDLMWEVRSADGRLVSCLLTPCAVTHAVVQYVDAVVSNVEEFDDLAVAWARVRALYLDAACAHDEAEGVNATQREGGP